MSYNPVTDFLALVRRTSNGARIAEVPGLDFVVYAMARAGMFLIAVSQTEPVTNQASTVWVKPAIPSWSAEAAIFLYNIAAGQYQPATPTLWAALIGGGGQVVQDVTAPGPANILNNAGIVRVNQLIAAPITLVMPASTLKNGSVLVSDWKGDAGTNNITIQMSGTDKLPGNLTSWTIAGDGGSVMFRPVSGGYVV